MKKINEIFYSLQGEGANAGTPAVFVRFSGCNLRCPFCDTEHESGRKMTDEEIVDEVKQHPATLVVLTGGEPTLQADEQLIAMLKKAGKTVAMETNGTRPVPKGVDFVTISPKDKYCKNAEVVLTECDELKVVFTGNGSPSNYDNIKARYRYIQPCDTGDPQRNAAITKACVEFIKQHPQWRLSLQTHKLIGIE